MSLPTLLLKGNLVATGYGAKQAELDELRPIDYIMDWFDKKVTRDSHSPNPPGKSPADKILMVRSSTGSGKSTVMMSELYHRYYERTKRNIACTQPRVFNAMDIPVKEVIPYNTKEKLRAAGFATREPLILEENIGYQTKAFTKKPTKGLIYMTIGVLTQQMKIMSTKDFMKRYSFIVIDEAHERSIDTDFVLMHMKKFISKHYKNPDCPFLIITSATFDPYKFADYMLSDTPKSTRYHNIVDVKGFSHPITDTFLEYATNDVIASAIELAAKIHIDNPDDLVSTEKFKDILIFVSGASEIKKIVKALEEQTFDNPIIAISVTRADIQGETTNFQNITRPYDEITLVPSSTYPTNKKWDKKKGGDESEAGAPFPSEDIDVIEQSIDDADKEEKREEANQEEWNDIQQEDHDAATAPETTGGAQKVKKTKTNTGSARAKKHPTRRIMVATNVGETGITYPNLKYVIDTGFYNSSEFDPTLGVELLINKPVTKGMYKQRRGRCGRNAPGHAFPLYTKAAHDMLQEDAYPEIIKEEITMNVLDLLIQEVDPESIHSDVSPRQLMDGDRDLGVEDYFKNIHKKGVDLSKIDLLDTPGVDSWHYALEKLYTLGAIDIDSVPTPLGIIMSKFSNIRAESIRAIFATYAWGVSTSDIITIAAFLEERRGDVFKGRGELEYLTALKNGEFSLFGHNQHAATKTNLIISDDFVSYLLVFHAFKKIALGIPEDGDTGGGAPTLDEWALKCGIGLDTLVKVVTTRDEIMLTLSMLGFNPYHCYDKGIDHLFNSFDNSDIEDVMKTIQGIKQCIFEGYQLNQATRDKHTGSYITKRSHIKLNLERPSVGIFNRQDISSSDNPPTIIYDKIRYMRSQKENVYEAIVDNVGTL
jgi:hypothetical protein